jgi:hypothetical protein
MSPAKKAGKSTGRSLDDGIRFGQLHLAIHVLGCATLGHITGAYCVTEFSGDMSLVRLREGHPFCVTCKSGNDDHTSLVRLYLARLGQPCPKGA